MFHLNNRIFNKFLKLHSVFKYFSVQAMAKPRVVFVLGAPGSGKGTQCEKIVENFGFTHLSAGELLRTERNNRESPVGQLIDTCIKEGNIVPVKITCGLLEKAINESDNSKFLIDGFPRNEDNLTGWNDQMDGKADVDFVLFIDTPEEVCTARILKRGETSGRKDDNPESLRKRFQTYVNHTLPIIKHYEGQNKVRTVKCDEKMTPDQVFEEVRKFFS